MELTFYANACCAYQSAGFTVLTDPWLVDGAFDGAWFHYPPLRSTPADLAGVDALYISHLHPDHLDPRTLATFRRDVPIIALEHGECYLLRMLGQLGFTNILACKPGEARRIGPFTVEVHPPFVKHAFFEASVGNLIDSALAIRDGESLVINTNDNRPSVEAAEQLRVRHGRPDIAQVNYNAAGPYPSCFHNLDHDAKRAAHDRVLERNLDHLVAVARALQPRWLMPFAGQYVIGGDQWRKNAVLGTTTPDRAAEHVARSLPKLRTLVLNEGLTFDTGRGEITNGRYVPIDTAAQERYIAEVLARMPYPHQLPDARTPSAHELRERLPTARARLWKMQSRWNATPNCHLYIDTGDGWFHVDFSCPETDMVDDQASFREPYLSASMDLRLLGRILERKSHWNNAEIGCHIDFVRRPDVYVPDVHTLMSFFHA